MIEIGDKTFVTAVWFVPSSCTDWFGIMYSQEGEPATLQYRFRYSSEKSEDKRNWYSFGSSAVQTDEYCERSLDAGAKLVAEMLDSEVEKVVVKGYGQTFIEKLSAKPWADFKINS